MKIKDMLKLLFTNRKIDIGKYPKSEIQIENTVKNNRSKAYIFQSELDFISRSILDYPNIETGGDLFGKWKGNYPHIYYVIGPGENFHRTVAFCRQDEAYLVKTGEILKNEFGLQHLGNWHSHHNLGLAQPSTHDASTMVRAIDGSSFLNKFFLIIGNIKNQASTINGFMFYKRLRENYKRTDWIVNNSTSPIRKSFDLRYPELVVNPKSNFSNISDLSISTEKNQSQKPIFSQSNWLSTKEGKAVLQELYKALTAKYGNVRMFNNKDKSFTLRFLALNSSYELMFLPSFPHTNPEIKQLSKFGNTLIDKDNFNGLSYKTKETSEIINYVNSFVSRGSLIPSKIVQKSQETAVIKGSIVSTKNKTMIKSSYSYHKDEPKTKFFNSQKGMVELKQIHSLLSKIYIDTKMIMNKNNLKLTFSSDKYKHELIFEPDFPNKKPLLILYSKLFGSKTEEHNFDDFYYKDYNPEKIVDYINTFTNKY